MQQAILWPAFFGLGPFYDQEYFAMGRFMARNVCEFVTFVSVSLRPVSGQNCGQQEAAQVPEKACVAGSLIKKGFPD